jgi:hypothetical protein
MAQYLYLDNRDGWGLRDFSKFIEDPDGFVQHEMNLPQVFNFRVARLPELANWVAPRRGAFVKFVDTTWDRRHRLTTDGVLFTGYVTEEPEPTVMGEAPDGSVQWGYDLTCTSEEYLANIHRLPPVTYVNKTRGFILSDLIRRMFPDQVPYDLSGVSDGGLEMLYEVDTDKKWSDVAADFAKADGFACWVLESLLYYGPQDEVNSTGDPLYNLTIDEDDPRWVPYVATVRRVSKDIVNDVTVFGEDEPADVVTEKFVSDGYQGFHNLAFEPFGLEENKIIDDDLTGSLDSGTWEVEDPSNFIQPFDGALNIVGGEGLGTFTTFLRAVKPIELAGVIECRDGEIYFNPSTAAGVAYLGGLHTSDTVSTANMFAGWYMNLFTTTSEWGLLQPVFNGAIQPQVYWFKKSRHYILRKFLHIKRPYGQGQAYSTSNWFSASITNNFYPYSTVSWQVEEINNDDEENVTSATREVLAMLTDQSPEPFALYTPLISQDAHFVMNFVRVSRPQQAIVTVNGKTTKIGSYLDGGRCEITVDDGKGKLNWYASESPLKDVSYTSLIKRYQPSHYLRFEETSGLFAYDSSGNAFQADNGGYGQLTAPVFGQEGAIGEGGTALGFTYATNVIMANQIQMGSQFTVSFWFRTPVNDSAEQILWTTRDTGDLGREIFISNGQLFLRTGGASAASALVPSIRTGLADGAWHNVVWTHNDPLTSLYIDGQPDAGASISMTNHVAACCMGQFYNGVSTTGGTFFGALDEVALFRGVVLTPAQIAELYTKSRESVPQVITIPKSGSEIEITYYRKQQASARVRNTESIAAEKALFRDDGVRQKIIRADDINPTPRNSDECLALAQAYLLDNQSSHYEGSYSFEAVEGTPTELRIWPMPGDAVRLRIDLPDSQIDEWVTLRTINSAFLGKNAYRFDVTFGPVTRYETVLRELLLKRRTSLEDPVISVDDADELADIVDGLPNPPNLTNYLFTADHLVASVAVAGLPPGADGIEVRKDDTGWGQPNYWGRFTTTFEFTRSQKDETFYARPFSFNSETGEYRYSKQSAVFRVRYPRTNNIVMSEASAVVRAEGTTVVIPIPDDDSDLAGYIIRNGSYAGAPIIFKGDGVTNEIAPTGTEVTISTNYVTVFLPDVTYMSDIAVNTYNLLGVEGTQQNSVPIAAYSAAASGQILQGTGTPEGTVTAPPGSIYLNTAGGTSTTLYVKESGTGNTGWRAI